MTVVAHTGVLTKPATDTVIYKVDLSDLLDLDIGNTVPVNDRIASVAWALDGASPATDINIVTEGFDEATSTIWVTLSGGTEGSIYHLNATVNTAGAALNGKTLGAQLFVRQIRVRISNIGAGVVC